MAAGGARFMYTYFWKDMRRSWLLAALVGCLVFTASCSSYPYWTSDEYLRAGIRITTDLKEVPDVRPVNRWSSVFERVLSAHDVAVWAANRLARDGQHDVLILVELISTFAPPGRDHFQNQNMWRISVYPMHPKDEI